MQQVLPGSTFYEDLHAELVRLLKERNQIDAEIATCIEELRRVNI